MSWLSKLLAPLGIVGEAVATVATAKVELERTRVENQRIRHAAEIEHHRIEADLQAEMRRLDHVRASLRDAYDVVRLSLEHQHIQRMRVLDTITEATCAIITGAVPAPERLVALETVKVLQLMLADTGTQAVRQLEGAFRVAQSSIDAAPGNRVLLDVPEEHD